MALDAHGVEICARVLCRECDEKIATRPDGSIRNHGRLKSRNHPRLGIEICPGSTPNDPAERGARAKETK